MNKFFYILFIFVLSALLTGCFPLANMNKQPDGLTAEELACLYVAQTTTAIEAEGQNNGNLTVADSGGMASENPEQTPQLPAIATVTPTPTVTLMPTLAVPMARVSVDTNCRTGPGKIYDWIGALMVGERAEVVARSADGLYWVIKNPNAAGECWIWGQYTTVEGPMAGLTVRIPPATPTPTVNWSGIWTAYFGIVPGSLTSVTLTLTVSGNNVYGFFLYMSDTITFHGTLSVDKMTVTGTWENLPTIGTFEWRMLGMDQFIGNADVTMAYCAERNGAGQPSPCMGS